MSDTLSEGVQSTDTLSEGMQLSDNLTEGMHLSDILAEGMQCYEIHLLKVCSCHIICVKCVVVRLFV